MSYCQILTSDLPRLIDRCNCDMADYCISENDGEFASTAPDLAAQRLVIAPEFGLEDDRAGCTPHIRMAQIMPTRAPLFGTLVGDSLN